MEKRTSLVVLSTAFCMISAYSPSLYAGDLKTVTDMCGNKVEVPVNPTRIVCMHCVSPEKIMTLGKGGSIIMMAEQSPWAYKLFPEIKNAQSNKDVKPEQMKDMKFDFMLYTPGMTKGDKYTAAGIKTVCAFSPEKTPMTINQYMESFKSQVSFFGDLLGPDAKAKADKYNGYFDKKVRQILAITSKIDKKNRPSVYYGGIHNSMLGTQGKGSVMHWNTEVAGGNYLPVQFEGNHTKATMQQVAAWDPDIILMGGYCDSIGMVTENPEWASLKAVKNGKVYLLPMGIYAWDNASNEGVLLMIHLAKTFHPEVFKGWDMIKEMTTFYSEVYGKTVTDKDAESILQHLSPL